MLNGGGNGDESESVYETGAYTVLYTVSDPNNEVDF